MSKRCSVACDSGHGVLLCELELDGQATVAEALTAAQLRLGAEIVDWEHAPTGIYGQACAREYVPLDGERIEVYRLLQIDPRARRRERVAAERRGCDRKTAERGC